jgi:hypothetical protein
LSRDILCTGIDSSPALQHMSAPRQEVNLRRRFPRYSADVRVTVQVFRSGENASMWGRSTELGEDGIGATMTAELEPGEVVSLELSLPLAAHPLKLRALVRYRMGLRHGFEFLALSPGQHDTIHRVCEMLAASQ